MVSIEIKGQRLELHPEKGIYWREEQALLLADLHLGKGAHFRRSGIAVPTGVSAVNFTRLRRMLEDFGPQRVLFLGDLFHSDFNHVWHLFCDFLREFPQITFELIPGNHDILPREAYAQSCLQLRPEILTIGPFTLSHHPLPEEALPEGSYNFYGHIHPGVRLVDRSGGALKLPAFHFGERAAILPAFGEFTGTARVPVRAGDRVFVVAEGKVIPMQ